MADLNDLRLHVANAITLADELLELHLRDDNPGDIAGAELLKRELDLVLRHARELAGLNPDGSFDQVPPAKKKGGGK
jgi:hypothetical protein